MLKDYLKKLGKNEEAINEDCLYCAKSNSDEDFIYETDQWKVFLASDQSYLGRCAIISKRHIREVSEISKEEWVDFAKITKKIEDAMKKAFKATMFNWTCLMNEAYKSENPDPHIVWHLRPRYANEVEFDKVAFWDKDFGHHYNRNKFIEVGKETKLKIIEKLKESF